MTSFQLFSHSFPCSLDKFEYILPRNVAMISGTIRRLLTSRGLWRELTGPMPVLELDTIPGAVLEKVIQYLFYKQKYDNATGPIPAFPIELDSVLPLLAAADFLHP